MADPKNPSPASPGPSLQETAAAREAARDKEREWDRRAEAREGASPQASPRAASESGLNFHVWHIDTTGQADRFDGTFSSLLDAQARVERASPDPLAVWVSEPGVHFFVAEDGLVTSLVDERSISDPFQDRLYAARGQRAVPGGALTVDTPNAMVPRPSEEAISTARAKSVQEREGRAKEVRTPEEAKRFEEDRKRQEDERKRREEVAKREAEGHVKR